MGFIQSEQLYYIIIFLVIVILLGVGTVLYNLITQNDDLKNLTVLVKETKISVQEVKTQVGDLSQKAASKEDLKRFEDKLNTAASTEDLKRVEQKVDSLNLPSNVTNNVLNYVFNLSFVLSLGLALISLEIIKFTVVSWEATVRPKFIGKAKLFYWTSIKNQAKINQTVTEYKLVQSEKK